MPTIHLTNILAFWKNAFAGLGILYVLQLVGIVNLTVQGIEISPSQAQAIQNRLEYSAETIRPARGAK